MHGGLVVPPSGFKATSLGRQMDWATTKGLHTPVYGTSEGFDSARNVNGFFTTASTEHRTSNIKQADWETHEFVPPLEYVAFARLHMGWETLSTYSHKALGSRDASTKAASQHSRKPLAADLDITMQYANNANHMSLDPEKDCYLLTSMKNHLILQERTMP